MKFFLASFLLVYSIVATAQAHETIIKDLKADWKVFSNGQYQSYDSIKDSHTIYFSVDTDFYKGATLKIKSQKEFSIFIGGKLITSSKKGIVFYDLDSLATLYSTPLEFSIRKPSVKMTTQLVIKNALPAESNDPIKRKEQYFLNFSVIASLVLLVFFVTLLRTNPKLTYDYLNFVKLFSVQEREENIMAIRITSSVNLLFYTFASLLTSFLLMVIFHFTYEEISLANSFPVSSLKDCFFQWLQLTGLILLTLVSKLFLVSMFSYLYKAPEITAIQFFNFVRLYFFTFGVIALLVAIFFIGKVLNATWYVNLFYVAASIFIFWELIIFLKLMTRLPFRIFHLFFYLCASELIPLVILIKVVFY